MPVWGRWTFTPLSALVGEAGWVGRSPTFEQDGTRVRLAVGYQSPEGPAGWLVGAAEILLRRRIAAAVAGMRQVMEE